MEDMIKVFKIKSFKSFITFSLKNQKPLLSDYRQIAQYLNEFEQLLEQL